MNFNNSYKKALSIYSNPHPSEDVIACCDTLREIVKVLTRCDISGANIILLAENSVADPYSRYSEASSKVLRITYCWGDITDPGDYETAEIPMSIINSADPLESARALVKEQRISELKEKILRMSDGIKRMTNSLDELEEELEALINT